MVNSSYKNVYAFFDLISKERKQNVPLQKKKKNSDAELIFMK